ncbi:molybdenum cofactor guanylyltransferase MobA [Paenochrobactrum pullorum]|uniref:molybdenum cofactor guanylyltransferase MobA n=1 Tax=Paenochrobactrum pullorum TaxID=1324351 RepID=UPI0035BBD6DE
MSKIQAHQIPVVILAGGRSSRMQAEGLSGDKYMHLLDGKPVIAHLIDRLQPQTDDIALNVNSDQNDLSQFNLPVIADQFAYNSGPLAGILTAMNYAKKHPLVLTAAADTPFIPANLIEKMWAAQNTQQADVVFASSHHKTHPTFGLWRTENAAKLQQWLQQGHKPSIMHFASYLQSTTFDFPFEPLKNGGLLDPFFNINEPADLVKARELQKQLEL